MWIKVINDGLSGDYESKSRWAGSLFIIVATVSAIYTLFSACKTVSVLGVTLLSVAALSSYLTAKIDSLSMASWGKTILLLVAGIAVPFVNDIYPLSLAMVVGIFFLLNTANSIYLAFLTRRDATALAWAGNSLLSAFFSYIVLSDIDRIAENTIGLLVAAALIADGLTLLYSGRTIYIRP